MNQCEHGQLARVCPLCEKDAEIEAGEREIEALRQDGSRLTERVRVLEALLERTVDHVHHGSQRFYDGVGGYEKRAEADSLLRAIDAAIRKGE